ncbi:hypothetical protein ADK48_31475 [Streptomyces rimosus subsp. rimosus]|nr:hypothetical protein DF17_30960 [Streptomyces rimosus]KOT30489.1 hypothetical protein ADK84_32045 [Streptomyces sp. NRRL WC-3701]KOT54669.1 hypothetical protein ADK45_30315 [Streptomyces rimosus subsp. rimosus]KEF17991.1 hypothetical protein DF18_25280 [Streptomyces rimosus]KOT63887.1 hypothetical protein ADK44_10190 [Streptomyces rimosus subsp. rimosus]
MWAAAMSPYASTAIRGLDGHQRFHRPCTARADAAGPLLLLYGFLTPGVFHASVKTAVRSRGISTLS